jgi:hypothetical protein
VEQYDVEERIWYKPWKKRLVTKDRTVTVTYVSMTLPGPLSMVLKLEKSFEAKVSHIVDAVSEWIEKTLIDYGEELAASAVSVGQELEQRLEERLATDVKTWTSDHAYWQRFQNSLPHCLEQLAGLRIFQENDIQRHISQAQ